MARKIDHKKKIAANLKKMSSHLDKAASHHKLALKHLHELSEPVEKQKPKKSLKK